MTNLFFSILPSEYEAALKDELWGCYKYIGIPFETLYNMPIQDRKYYIQRHNAESKEQQEQYEASTNGHVMTHGGEAINSFAAMEQQKK